MQRIASLTDYYSVVKKTKAEKKTNHTNCFLFPETIQRYIRLGRFYYEECQGGTVFYTDEEKYYQAYYYFDSTQAIDVSPKDKDMVINHMFTEDKKNDRMTEEETRLKEAGFVCSLHMRQTTGDPQTILTHIETPARIGKRLLKSEGFELQPIQGSAFKDYFAVRENTKEIPYYQYPFSTEEELEKDAQDGRLSGIFDRNGQLCALRHSFMEGNSMYGWLIVKEQYREKYGMAVVLSEHAMQCALKNRYKVFGWIELSNMPSIKYHTAIGYQWTNRCMDTWILPGS